MSRAQYSRKFTWSWRIISVVLGGFFGWHDFTGKHYAEGGVTVAIFTACILMTLLWRRK